ncbi:hypothetical protein [Neomoorella glycerini]|uniref:hypothetical protein n=1 Tax=Neomoorella glycerini TaxID=55779 RepID=UPI0014780B47|nr:hypothetical protein [Moorella glycerini]
MADEAKILVVFYSLYGNTAKLARAVAAGVEEVPGCAAILKRVPATMSAAYQKAQAEMRDIPLATLDDLLDVDGHLGTQPRPATHGARPGRRPGPGQAHRHRGAKSKEIIAASRHE